MFKNRGNIRRQIYLSLVLSIARTEIGQGEMLRRRGKVTVGAQAQYRSCSNNNKLSDKATKVGQPAL